MSSNRAPSKTYSYSAAYFHNFIGGDPGIAAQCNAGAVRTICRRLNIPTFWIAAVTENYQRWIDIQRLYSDPDFHAATDYKTWRRHLPRSHCTSLSDLLSIDAKFTHRKWETPAEKLTPPICDHIVHQYAYDLIAGERSERRELHEALRHTRDLLEREKEATKRAKQELDDANFRHNSLLHQVNIGDNSEESGIVKRFLALNRLIEDFSIHIGHEVHEDLLKQFPNTSSCYDKMKTQEPQSSNRHRDLLLTLSNSGVSMDTTDFVGLLLGSIICEELHSKMFQPFYPSDGEEAKSSEISIVYERLRKRGR